MSVELRPLGVKCNIACHYCYQNAERQVVGNAREYDLEQMKEALLREGSPFTLFGGEPLLIAKPDLEELFAFGFKHFGENSIQTNGTLLDQGHVDMFLKYKVAVGLSIDGPGRCNAARWAGSQKRTAEATQRSEDALDLLLSRGIKPGIIVTLHRANAQGDAFADLIDWLVSLDHLGIATVRLHLLEVDSEAVRQDLLLDEDQACRALEVLRDLERRVLKRMHFDIFREMETLLCGTDGVASCTWRGCDPYTTPAVRGIEGHGHTSNCGRTNKSGVDYLKAKHHGVERYLALYQTPQADGGCAGCRFFLACKGQCPGTALEGDWRNRSEQCILWMHMFNRIEADLVAAGAVPISLRSDRERIERIQVESWLRGENPPLSVIVAAAQEHVA